MRTLKYLIFLFCLHFISCGKEFLEIKRDANQVVPSTVKDYKAILARNNLLMTSNDLAFLGADEYYIQSEADLIAGSAYTPFHQKAYVWADDVYEGAEVRDWNEAYEKIMYANLALDVEKLMPKADEKNDYKSVQIAARFHRAWNFYQLAQLFCVPYNKNTAKNDLGLPLRLDYDVSLTYGRSTLEDVYQQILKDLHEAESFGEIERENIYFPGATAVQALMARTYLQMGDFHNALVHAENVLRVKSTMVDYNNLSGNITNVYSSYFKPYGADNPSVIFYSFRAVGGIMGATRINADTSLVNSLEVYDLRRKMFFPRPNGTLVYIGFYSGAGANNPFTGLTVEEVILIAAECQARLGNTKESLRLLNILRMHRIDKDHVKELTVENVDDALACVLEERRRELYLRGTRWEDLRRLNKEDKYSKSVKRIIDGKIFELLPNESRWVWQLPNNEIDVSGISPNSR